MIGAQAMATVQDDMETARPLAEPKPPFPKQKQRPPGLESELDPAPRWRGERYRPAGKLQGQAALVTGGDSGIGRAVAYHFGREGADVAITSMVEDRSDADDTKRAIEELGRRCEIYEGDLRDTSFCETIVRGAAGAYGRLDILVHNAAWQQRRNIEELDDEQIERTLQTNIAAYLKLVRIAKPHLKPGASIIATGSIVGLQGSGRLNDYGATKGAIHTITKCLAEELIDDGIRVNCVAPGPVWTPLNPSDTGFDEDSVGEFGRKAAGTPMGRPAQPEELAPAYVFLASNADSSYVTGAVLPVVGGPV
jgi:NAD(P)-dependent dehydrogenase (short-subunit alcohol dehydrogenase family)